MDVVIGTLVLCSVNNIDMALRGNNYTSLARAIMAISFFINSIRITSTCRDLTLVLANLEIQMNSNT